MSSVTDHVTDQWMSASDIVLASVWVMYSAVVLVLMCMLFFAQGWRERVTLLLRLLQLPFTDPLDREPLGESPVAAY